LRLKEGARQRRTRSSGREPAPLAGRRWVKREGNPFGAALPAELVRGLVGCVTRGAEHREAGPTLSAELLPGDVLVLGTEGTAS
jgi:hypothetical protein